MSWLYVAIGIVCLIALQMLRAVVSTVFPRVTARPVRAPDPASFGGMDLLPAKIEAYERLGFSGPTWVVNDHPESVAEIGASAHAAFRNVDQHVVAWLGPTVDVNRPNQLLTYYSTLLTDGRYAVTQAGGTYFECVDDPRTPAQTIAPSDEATEMAAHLEFVASLDVPPARSNPREDVFRFIGEHTNEMRSRMLERGILREMNGSARPSLAFGIRLLRHHFRTPKPSEKQPPGDIPVERLGYLAQFMERVRDRAPSQPMQWLLFAISAALSVGIGWPIFGLELTLAIVAVIALHEGGHWLAMRLYGYRNPHVTLLPLVGGVTIGHETDPSAAKRAWVAMAGPLPGILLGWAVLFLYLANPAYGDQGDSALLIAAIVLLSVNYLNVLPVPPLDGSHIMQAILPARAPILQIGFIIVGVAIGAYVAWLLEFWPLAAIATLQLFGIRSLRQQASLASELRKAPFAEPRDDTTLRRQLLESLHEKLGPPGNVASRIGMANAVLNLIRLQPMGGAQRLAVSGIFGALLVVPVAGILLSTSLFAGPQDFEVNPEVARMNDQAVLRLQEVDAEVDAMGLAELVTRYADSVDVPPASTHALLSLEQRFGGPLPGNVSALYRLRNGQLKGLAIGRAEDLQPVRAGLFSDCPLKSHVFDGTLYFYSDTLGERAVPIDEAGAWWLLGESKESATHAFIDPHASDGEPALFIVGAASVSMFVTTDEWIRYRARSDGYAAVYDEQWEEMVAARATRLEGLTVSEIMALYPEPPLLTKLVTRDFGDPGPATPAEIADVERRIGRKIPPDHVEALGVHNGFERLGVFSTSEILPISLAEDYIRESAISVARESGLVEFSESMAADCWVVGGWYQPSGGDPQAEPHPTMFWCPDLPGGKSYISADAGHVRSTFTEVVRDRAALHGPL